MKRKTPTLEILHNLLKLRGKHAPDAPLDGQESMIFDVIRKHYEQGAGKPQTGSSTSFQTLVDTYGQKQIVGIFMNPVTVLGVQAPWFVGSVFISLAVLTLTQSLDKMIATTVIVHLAGVVYYQVNRKRLREATVHKILTEGIK